MELHKQDNICGSAEATSSTRDATLTRPKYKRQSLFPDG